MVSRRIKHILCKLDFARQKILMRKIKVVTLFVPHAYELQFDQMGVAGIPKDNGLKSSELGAKVLFQCLNIYLACVEVIGSILSTIKKNENLT
jgi:hypothetical protein